MENTENIITITEWTAEHENILIEWADKAMVFRWLHSKAHAQYSHLLMWFTIPVIIMSTITGTANFAQDRLPVKYRGYAQMGIGATNIFAGILTTIQQFLKIGELNESHRVASTAWDKFYRNTKVELAKAPHERTPVVQILKISKSEFDRLMETSPNINEKIITKFKNTFSDGLSKIKGKYKKDELTDKQIAYLELIKPEICDTIESTAKFVYRSTSIPDLETQKQQTVDAIKLAQEAISIKDKQKMVEDIILHWKDTFDRIPNTQEIVNELDDKTMEEFVKKYVEQYKEKPLENIIITDETPV